MTEDAAPVFTYSPDRRTALVLCGTGAHGAYHAGVLRALQEAGVKIDVVAGQGIGAATAAVAAIDGGARLWDASGLWQSAAPATMYGWKPLLRVTGWITAALALILLVPLFVLCIGLFRHDQLIDDGVPRLGAQVHRRSEARAIGRNAIEVDHRDLADTLLEHGDTRIDDILALLRRFVLGVLAQVAQFAGALNLLREIDLQLALQRGDLVVEFLEDPVLHLVFRL